VNDSAQIQRLVPFTQFATDLAGDTLPTIPSSCRTCAAMRTHDGLSFFVLPAAEAASH